MKFYDVETVLNHVNHSMHRGLNNTCDLVSMSKARFTLDLSRLRVTVEKKEESASRRRMHVNPQLLQLSRVVARSLHQMNNCVSGLHRSVDVHTAYGQKGYQNAV